MNEPYLGSALSILGELLDRATAGCIPPKRIALLGSCRAPAWRSSPPRPRGRRLDAVIGLSGGLIGDTLARVGVRPPQGMPALLGCSERHPHIPIARVRKTDAIMRALGAEVVPASTGAAARASTRTR